MLIVAGQGLAAEISALTSDLADGHISASGLADDTEWTLPLAPRAVALLNKGTPGGVVSPDGTLSLSLMRACSAWPCGVWIDGDRRTAPDGSSFAWQHWSHTFEYALASGSGLARSCGFNELAEDYNHPLVAVPGSGTSSGVSVSPPEVALTALKPFGNPASSGREFAFDGDVTVRLRETSGTPLTATVTLPGPLSGAWLTDLLESGLGAELPVSDGSVLVEVPAFGTVTLVVRPAAGVSGAAADAGGSLAYARYWLHGTGPAPVGNLPVAVHVTPARVALPSADDSAVVQLTVARGPVAVSGSVDLVVPDGLSVTPAGPLPYALDGGDFASWELTVRALSGTAPGRYFIGARLGDSVEEAMLVAVGEGQPPSRDMDPEELFFRLQSDHVAQTDEVSVEVVTRSVAVAPGGSGSFTLRVASQLASSLRGQVQLLSPFGSWGPDDLWEQPVRVPAGGTTELVFPVSVPLDARPGQRWWLLAKVMYFGRVRYTESIPLTVIPPT